ncbi:toll/interleukin-1 receptor domain-containing protein [Corallococcus carmarthensis]|nr:toll/interleukin-1 receptor domain-containing protein [Corallococcus carmarthensis]
MPPPLVFLSHSSNRTPGALEDTGKLRDALAGASHDVQLDFRTIQGGDDWYAKILEWLVRCRAAVLLLSPDALQSDWVYTEATFLKVRKQLDPQLILIPVLIRGVTKQSLSSAEKFIPLQLHTLQCIEATDAASSAPQVLAALGPAVHLVVPEQVQAADKIAALLVRMGGMDLSNTFVALTLAEPPWHPGTDRNTLMAQLLARHMLKLGISSATRIMDVLGRGIDASAKADICRILAAFWVHEKAANHISEAKQRTPTAWAVAINGNFLPDFTAEAYARRAFWPSEQWRFIPIEGGAGTDFVRHVTESILKWVERRNPGSQRKPEQWLARTDISLLVVIPERQWVDHQALNALRLKFPRITFILETGEELPDLHGEGFSEVTLARPALDLLEEDKAQQAFSDAFAMIRGD